MDKLRNDGYILIENVKYKKIFNDSLHSFYNNNIINYKKLKIFIDNQYCPILNKIIHNNHKIYYNRFKFNNNNVTHGTIFHADIYNHTNENIINMYSCLYYFDNAYLEIIPNSHRKDFLMKHSFHSSYQYKKKFLYKKELLLFYTLIFIIEEFIIQIIKDYYSFMMFFSIKMIINIIFQK